MTVELTITEIDPNDLSLRDTRDFLKYTKQPTLEKAFAIIEEGLQTVEAIETMAYLLYLLERKNNPDFTPEDALDVPMKSLSSLAATISEDPPEGDSKESSE